MLLVISVLLVNYALFRPDSTDAAAAAVLEEQIRLLLRFPVNGMNPVVINGHFDQRSELSLTIKSDAIVRKYVEGVNRSKTKADR